MMWATTIFMYLSCVRVAACALYSGIFGKYKYALKRLRLLICRRLKDYYYKPYPYTK